VNHIQMEHRKGAPLYLSFPMVDSASSVALKSGVSPVDTAYYKDGDGSWSALSITDTASEIGSTGIYEIDLTASEANHDQIMATFAVAGAEVTAITVTLREHLAQDMTPSNPSLRAYASSDDNVISSKQSVSFIGSEDSGSHASAAFADGTYHEISSTGNDIDLVYEFTTANLVKARYVKFVGYVQGSGDAIDVQAYNGSTWDTIGTIQGNGTNKDQHRIFPLNDDANDDGYTYIRLIDDGSSTSPSLFIDELTLGVETDETFEGYRGGMIWVDSGGASSAIQGYTGTYDNPCTWAVAKTLAPLVGVNRFHVVSGDTVTLDAASDDFSFFGDNYNLALGGQSVAGLYVEGATVTGVGSGTGTTQIFHRCRLGSHTQVAGTYCTDCAITGTVTVGEAGDYFWKDCYAAGSGTTDPVFDFGGSITNTNWKNRGWQGTIQVENMNDAGTDTIEIEGTGELIEGTCSAASAVSISGNMTVSGITNMVVSDDARVDAAQILDAVTDDNTKVDASALNTASATNSPAIKAQTDKLNFTSSNNVKADIEEINDITIQGTGESSNKWRPV